MFKHLLKQLGFIVLFNLGTLMIVSQLMVYNKLGDLPTIYGGCFVLSVALAMLIPLGETNTKLNDIDKTDT